MQELAPEARIRRPFFFPRISEMNICKRICHQHRETDKVWSLAASIFDRGNLRFGIANIDSWFVGEPFDCSYNEPTAKKRRGG